MYAPLCWACPRLTIPQVEAAIVKHPELAEAVRASFQFKIKNCGEWVLDLRQGSGDLRRVCAVLRPVLAVLTSWSGYRQAADV